MELRHFRYFVAVAEHSSFTQAAARLHVSQPTLSQQVRQLEHELGAPLFHRGPEGTRLSPVGEVFYRRVRAIQEAIDDAASEVRRMAAEGTVLRIGVCPPLPDELHVPIVSAFRTACPHVRLSLHELGLPDYVTPLLDGEVDAALLYPPLDPELLTWEALVAEPRGLVVSRRHPFWEADEVGVADYLSEPLPHIGTLVPDPIRRFWTMSELRNEEAPRFVGEPACTATELMLAVGLHGTICPAPWAYRQAPPGPRLRTIPISGVAEAGIVAARRLQDKRPLPAVFCSLAARTAGKLSRRAE
ncbi:LysR family transcriptional regulator [Amycolatopsis sp. NPDC003861]